jgi:hypothetical protein
MTEEMSLTTKVKTRALKQKEDPKLVELKLVRDRFRAATAVEVIGVEQLEDLTPEVLDKKFREGLAALPPGPLLERGQGVPPRRRRHLRAGQPGVRGAQGSDDPRGRRASA